jgi:hypothetical protein
MRYNAKVCEPYVWVLWTDDDVRKKLFPEGVDDDDDMACIQQACNAVREAFAVEGREFVFVSTSNDGKPIVWSRWEDELKLVCTDMMCDAVFHETDPNGRGPFVASHLRRMANTAIQVGAMCA